VICSQHCWVKCFWKLRNTNENNRHQYSNKNFSKTNPQDMDNICSKSMKRNKWSVKLNQKPFKYSTFFPSDSWISDFIMCASQGKIGEPSSYGVVLSPCPRLNLFWFGR
jgi:hypothetical protein